jgi:hypothetical protein
MEFLDHQFGIAQGKEDEEDKEYEEDEECEGCGTIVLRGRFGRGTQHATDR